MPNSAKFKNIGIINVIFGKNVTVIYTVNFYECIIGNNSFIGPFVEIQKNVIIGRRCEIHPTRSFVS
jgi:UDP-3-O-[3-hydroxymyristoyl] glucosamine N-acyltransferase